MSLSSTRDAGQGPRVLVLLATHDGTAWLVAQLATIAAQTGVEVHVLASDDRSKDDTLRVLAGPIFAELVSTLPAWPGAGSSGGNFYRLIRECDPAPYDYVAFSDQDDLWYADKLCRACAALQKQGASGYSSAVRAFWPDGRSRLLHQSDRLTSSDFLFEGAGQGCTFVLRSDTFAELKAFVISHPDLASAVAFHDWLAYAISRIRGERWIFDPLPSVDYRQHASNALGARGGRAGIARRVELLRNGWYGNEISAVSRALQAADPGNDQIERFKRARAHGRLGWALYLMSSSRRRVTDRLTLAAAALLGWLT